MARFYYNGVLLPEIPQDVLAEYPYCWIRSNSDGVTYDFILGKYKWYCASSRMMTTSSTYVWYTATTTSESLTYKTSYTDTGDFNLGNGLVWSNHDIFTSNTTTYFEATELVPEIEEDVSWYQIKRSTLEDFGDEARRIDGSELPLTTSQMLEIFKSVGGNESNGGTYADQLYKHYGLDSTEYPYMWICLDSNKTTATVRMMKQRDNDGSYQYGYWTSSINGLNVTDASNVGDVVAQIMSKNKPLQALNSTYFNNYSDDTVYANFDCGLEHFYKLDVIPLPYNGLANGYDVMFYDENDEGLAFYSIKQGHSINPPEYQVKAWQTSDGAIITFPYTPNADVILYANNSTYAQQLYNFYSVDSAVYPYVYVLISFYDLRLVFAKSISTNKTSSLQSSNVLKADYTMAEMISDYTNLEEIVSKTCVSGLTLAESDNTANSSNSSMYCYSNFTVSTTFKSKYRLDQ